MTVGNVVVLGAAASVFAFALVLIVVRSRLASLLDPTPNDLRRSDLYEVPRPVRVATTVLLIIGLLGILMSIAILAIGLSVTS